MELIFSIAHEDFLLLTNQLTFNPGNGLQEDCATITVMNDTILEGDENFSVVLTTTDPDVTISPNTTVVTVTNDDSKYLFLVVHKHRWTVSRTDMHQN